MSPTAVYAGSFDPFTNGHLHVLTQSLRLFDKVYLLLARHPTKIRSLPESATLTSLTRLISDLSLTSRVSVALHTGLTIDFAHAHRATFLIRGLRSAADYAYEEDLAAYNLEHGDLDTIYFRAGSFATISSSATIKLFQQGKDVSTLVPPATLALLQDHLCP